MSVKKIVKRGIKRMLQPDPRKPEKIRENLVENLEGGGKKNSDEIRKILSEVSGGKVCREIKRSWNANVI